MYEPRKTKTPVFSLFFFNKVFFMGIYRMGRSRHIWTNIASLTANIHKIRTKWSTRFSIFSRVD